MMKMFANIKSLIFLTSLIIAVNAKESETQENDLSLSSLTKSTSSILSSLSSSSSSLSSKQIETTKLPLKSNEKLLKATHEPDLHSSSSSIATHPPFPITKKTNENENPLKSFPSTSLTQSLRQWFKDRLSFFSPTVFVPLSANKATINKQQTVSSPDTANAPVPNPLANPAANAINFWTKIFQSIRKSFARRNEQLPPKPKNSNLLASLLNKMKLRSAIKQNEHLARDS